MKRAVESDLLRFALDLAGLPDAAATGDPVAAAAELAVGRYLDDVIAGLKRMPSPGELVLLGRSCHYSRAVEEAVRLAREQDQRAKRLVPGLRTLLGLLELLPPKMGGPLARCPDLVRQNLEAQGLRPRPVALPDVSTRFDIPPVRTVTLRGRPYRMHTASGWLGVPGRVRTCRDESAQARFSRGTGMDAGHLIGTQFGAPGTGPNLALQSWMQNEGGGTYHALEKAWADLLQAGGAVWVQVNAWVPVGLDPHAPDLPRLGDRDVHFRLIRPNGQRECGSRSPVAFVNFHTPDVERGDGSTRKGTRTIWTEKQARNRN